MQCLPAWWIILLGVCFPGVMGQYSINMRISSSRVREGDKVVATCRVYNHLDSAVLLYWVKRVGEEEVDIATGPQLTERFDKTKRYRVEQNAVKPLTEFIFTLHIDEAKAEDSGEIGCRIPNQEIQVFKKLTVASQIQSVKLSSKDLDNSHAVIYAHGNNNTAMFNEGETRKVSCRVNGSYPKPTVQIQIGDKDITHLFKEKFEEINNGISRGRYYVVELYNDQLEIDYSYTGKNLTCTAKVQEPITNRPGEGGQGDSGREPALTWYPPVSTSVGIVLKEYRPKFLCDQLFTAKLYERDVKLECLIQSDPPTTGASFHYTVMGVLNETVTANETFGQYKGLLINQDKHRQKAVLNIGRAFPQHFRKYYFEATNQVGSSIHEVVLRRDTREISSVAPGVGSEWCGISLLLLSLISMTFVNVVLN